MSHAGSDPDDGFSVMTPKSGGVGWATIRPSASRNSAGSISRGTPSASVGWVG